MVDDEDVELRRCPFCAGEVRMWQDEDPYGPGGPVPIGWIVACQKCSARMEEYKRDRAIKAWNHRAMEKAKVGFMSGDRADDYWYVAIGDFVLCEDGHPDFPETFDSKSEAQRALRKLKKGQ
jgi:hypothetical protein